MISGRTRVFGLLGFPVSHSVSPAMHNAAFAELGLDCVYTAFPVRPERLKEAVAAVRALDLGGVNVTVPHKESVGSFLDQLAEEARLIGAVNTIVVQDGRLVGHNTDAGGFHRSLTEAGFEIAGKKVVLLGAGGAARGASVQLALAGVRRVVFVNRTVARAEALAALIKRLGGQSAALSWDENEALEREITAADLVVQTTTLGMHPDTESCPPVLPQWLRRGQLVYDMVYNPRQTRFLQMAAEVGALTVSGAGMLLHQGALAFELWTGRQAPLDVMRGALEGALNPAQPESDGDNLNLR
ncbi:MAG: shikimate dehydrogenase [Desulforudis sp.]|nr:MAG: shikimate dehydrogenase [Desulforudis sp.]